MLSIPSVYIDWKLSALELKFSELILSTWLFRLNVTLRSFCSRTSEVSWFLLLFARDRSWEMFENRGRGLTPLVVWGNLFFKFMALLSYIILEGLAWIVPV